MSKAIGLAILVLVAGLMAYIRFAPADPADWHIPLNPRPPAIAIPSPNTVTTLPNGAYVDLRLPPDQTQATLAKLDAIALATPRSRRLAGSVATGHITWQSRSLLWGFPDYTTAQATPQGLTIFARQRFGSGDWGVNAARLRAWLGKL